ncbi:biotin/lipoyl-binding protein [bacterium]|nr:biotin/lipoyl-binding protein [bacterium]
MKFKKPNWFVIFFAVASVVVAFLYFRFHIDKQFIGIVESKSHMIGSQEPGIIRNVLVEVGDAVKKGQLLATLDISDLESQISQLKNELSAIEELKEAHEDRYFLEYQRLATNLADRLSLLESKRVELNGLKVEIGRLEKAEDAGLGHSRDLADLILQRDVLIRYLEIQSAGLQAETQNLDASRENRYIIKRSENDKIVKSMLSDIMARTEDLRRELILTEHRVNLRTIVSPCDGYVVDQFAYTGDVVQGFIPVLSIEEVRPQFVTVYLPEKTNISLEKGMRVKVYSARLKKTILGEIVFIHPNLTQTNERLSFRGQLFWARKVLVKLKEDHGLLGGEVIYARINHFGKKTSSTIASDVE